MQYNSNDATTKPIDSDVNGRTYGARNQNRKRSDIEACDVDDEELGQPNPKKIKLDSDGNVHDAPNHAESVDTMADNATDCLVNALKIENLVDLPVEILLEIFDRTDDIDLVHLAITCKRFAAIAKSYLINCESMDGGTKA